VFEGFELALVETPEATLRVRRGGSGPPVLLLHGHPQTHVMWHAVAPPLAERFTVVCPDLRGYGDSSKPESTPDHEPYSKRAMARDMVVLMQQLGFESFCVAGHDRGGRVAYRLALDHPEVVEKLAVLDIVPTADAWRGADMDFGMINFQWFFMAQPAPLPELMIERAIDQFFFRGSRDAFAPDALEDYLRCLRNPGAIHAFCEDYRAGATIDRELDEADRGKRRIGCPVLVLWAGNDEVERWHDVIEVWRQWADDVRGKAIEAGHHFPEEAPEPTYKALRGFFAH
jgi:haloacetate dehalogenase